MKDGFIGIRIDKNKKAKLEKIAFNLNKIDSRKPYDVSMLIEKAIDRLIEDHVYFLKEDVKRDA